MICLVVVAIALSYALPVADQKVGGLIGHSAPSSSALGSCSTSASTCSEIRPDIQTAVTTADLTVSSADSISFAGSAIVFQATLPAGQTAVGYTWWWGNGNVTSTSGGTTSYAYPVSGTYLVYVQAVNSTGGIHDNLHALLRHIVVPSAATDTLGNYPTVAGSIVANSTTNANATAAIGPGGFVTVENWVASLPSDPQWSVSTPSYSVAPSALPYVTLSASILNASGINGVSAAFGANTPNGSYWLKFSVTSSGPSNGATRTVWSNFTFTIFVENGTGTPTVSLPSSPHPGSLRVYVIGNPTTWDPALLYDTTDAGIVQNVVQTLIFRNVSQVGSNPQDFVPDLATCVPGTALCQKLYGSSLVDPQGDYTFVLNPNATFYNASDGAHWQVQPVDVAFTLDRSCLEANYNHPSFLFGGWDLCQTILPGPSSTTDPANASYDGGLHYPYNNTPANILSAIVVNDSSSCPLGSPMRDGVHGNGCVTFVTSRSGHSWPQFLNFLANAWAGVLGCSWTTESFSAYRLPGWWNGSGCWGSPPGSPGNPNGIPSDTAWDTNLNFMATSLFNTPIRFEIVGSGPYAIASESLGSGGEPTRVQLTDNPYWGGTPCIGAALAGCLPSSDLGGVKPTFSPSVSVYFNLTGNSSAGLAAIANGTADLVDPSGSDYGTLASDLAGGKVQVTEVPGIIVNWLGMNLNYSTALGSQTLGSPSSLPSTLLQDLNLRQFLVNAYPWTRAQEQYCSPDGFLTCFQMAGMIPAYMSGFTPSNLTWPESDPSTNASQVGSAAWWWSQAEADGIVSAHCTSVSPCTFPVPGIFGLTAWNGSLGLWVQSVESISGGAIKPVLVSAPYPQVGDNSTAPPGIAGYPTQWDGWAPDIFDPSNYLILDTGFYYGASNSLTDLLQSQYEAPCPGPVQDPQVTESCQGTAYQNLLKLIDQGATCAPPSCSASQRELIYNEADHIEASLGLYLPTSQSGDTFAIGPWIDPASIAHDPMSGSFASVLGEPLFDVRYLSVVPPVYPLVVSALNGVPPVGAPLVRVGGPLHAAGAVPTIETGETLLILVTAAGGTGVYHYQWNGLPTGCASQDAGTITCTPSGTGTFTLQANVTDTRADKGSSPPLTLSVVQGPTITGFTVTPSLLRLGESATFAVSTSGGIGTLRLSYAGLPAGCVGGNATSFTCTPSAVGSFTVVAFAKDSIGIGAVANVTLTVSSSPTPTPAPSGGYSLLDLVVAIGTSLATSAIASTSVSWWMWKRRSREGRDQPGA